MDFAVLERLHTSVCPALAFDKGLRGADAATMRRRRRVRVFVAWLWSQLNTALTWRMRRAPTELPQRIFFTLALTPRLRDACAAHTPTLLSCNYLNKLLLFIIIYF